jgi:hypothetical protein
MDSLYGLVRKENQHSLLTRELIWNLTIRVRYPASVETFIFAPVFRPVLSRKSNGGVFLRVNWPKRETVPIRVNIRQGY